MDRWVLELEYHKSLRELSTVPVRVHTGISRRGRLEQSNAVCISMKSGYTGSHTVWQTAISLMSSANRFVFQEEEVRNITRLPLTLHTAFSIQHTSPGSVIVVGAGWRWRSIPHKSHTSSD